MINLNQIYADIEDFKYKKQMKLLNEFNLENIPNIIFYGSKSSGKKNILSSLFKNENKRKDIRSFDYFSKKIEYTLYVHKNIIEIDLEEIKLYKSVFFKTVFLKILKNNMLDGKNRIFIFHKMEILMKKDQYMLRKIMEDHISRNRFILLTNNIDRLIEPIKSRFLCIRLEGFTEKEIKKVDRYKKNPISVSLKEVKLENYLFNEVNNDEYKNKYQYIKEYYSEILKFIYSKKNNTEESIRRIDDVLYKLNIFFEIDYSDIIKHLAKEILMKKKLYENDEHRELILEKLLEYEIRLKNTSKEIIHVESFIYFFKNYLSTKIYI